jgi:hypothetical protein
MRPLALALLTFAACTNGVPHIDKPPVDPHGQDAGLQTQGCMRDEDCGMAEVCVNCQGVGECTPGCSNSSQCDPRDICQLGTVCQTCPCPPGWCVLNPCRDDDGDGYVPGDDPTVTCSGKLKGDCDDRAPDVHPGAPELCKNYRDDNCDGLFDERDPQCVCPSGEQRCTTSWDCGAPGGMGCTKGCCEPCANPGTKPTCDFGAGTYCAQQSGEDPTTGCTYGWACEYCGGCGVNIEPVCGVNGSTFDNSCYLQQRGVKLLHTGACLPGEGVYCELQGQPQLDGGCGPSGDFYCRQTCPNGTSCGAAQCTRKGACISDADCPAGLAAPPPADCDGGTAALRCVNAVCVSRCGS